MKVLIIGGTGTLGHALVPLLLKKHYEITILSREEIKQKKMESEYPECRYVLGDIRDYESIEPYILDCNALFHFAAMKHVDLAEKNLNECIKINLLGTMNIIKAANKSHNLSYAAFSSTDKAVLPINAYGHCKALSEKLWLNANYKDRAEVFNVFRWGNVLGSRGSVLHSFVKTLKEEKKVYITDLSMTRFWIHIDDAAKFMLNNFEYSNNGNPYIPEMKAAPLIDLARMTAHYLGITNYKVERIPIRPGEKLHEWLDYHDPSDEMKSNNVPFYTDDELLALIERTLK